MSRPTDWYVVDLGGDPTPGEAWGVRSLAREYGEIAASARSESTVLTRVQSSGSSAVWVGEAAEVFREKLEDFPENIAKCAASFEIVRDAMYSWASSVESWQTQADTNLNKARLARADIEAAQAVLEAAQAAASSVQGDLDRALRTYNQYQYVEPPASVKVPTAYQISQLRYRATGASSSTTSASGTVQEAQDRFDAAKALVLAAAEEFTSAAKTVVGLIEAAKDAGVEADSWWEKIYHSDAWQVMVTIVTVVVIVAAIAAYFVTGPLALIISAVAIVGNVILNAQDIMSFVAGDMSAAEFATMLALAFLPGGRAMKSLNKATDAAIAADVASRRATDATASVIARRLDDASIPVGTRNGVASPGYTHVDGQDGRVTYIARPDLTAEEIAQSMDYVDGSNFALLNGRLSPTGRVSTEGDLRRRASAEARAERLRAEGEGNSYLGQVGHVPDSTWSGDPLPPSWWADQSQRVNASFGGQSTRYPVGFRPSGFEIILKDGAVYPPLPPGVE